MQRQTMAMRRLSVLFALLGGVAALTSAQTPGTMSGDLQTALERAQAAALRPGDESLSCEALATELVAVAKDTALQANVAKRGAEAQEKMARLNAMAKEVAAPSALTFFSSIVPGAAWAGQAAAAAQMPAQRAQATRNVQQVMQQAQEMMPIMPQLMRGQRVIELAQARDCAWLREAR
jgi:hypothetical protein